MNYKLTKNYYFYLVIMLCYIILIILYFYFRSIVILLRQYIYVRYLKNYNYLFKNKEIKWSDLDLDRTRSKIRSDPVSHKQVMNIYIFRTEILYPNYLLLDEHSEPKPILFENNKYMIRNLIPNTFKIRIQI
jgi:hypothetical protein